MVIFSPFRSTDTDSELHHQRKTQEYSSLLQSAEEEQEEASFLSSADPPKLKQGPPLPLSASVGGKVLKPSHPLHMFNKERSLEEKTPGATPGERHRGRINATFWLAAKIKQAEFRTKRNSINSGDS